MNILKNLGKWFFSTDDVFKQFEKFTLDGDDKEKRRIFIDRNSKVLFVAHADTVLKPEFKSLSIDGLCIKASGLDDRLGCMIAYELSEELQADLLITDNEESCQSTAYYHDCKSYNWIVEFDRCGEDYVTYGLNNKDFMKQLDKLWKHGMGSYSDICHLNSKKCRFNLGIGYFKAHAEDSYCHVEMAESQIALFRQFYKDNYNTDFGNIKCDYEFDYREDFELYNSEYLECDICGGGDASEIFGYQLCENCMYELMQTDENKVNDYY